MEQLDERKRDLLELWGKNIQRVQTANHEAENWFSRLHLLIGIPAVLVTASISVGAFTDLLQQDKWILAILGLLATALTSLQAFLNFGDRAAKHGNAAIEYACLKRRLQEFKAFDPASETEVQAFVQELRESFDSLSRATPHTPQHIWRKMLKKFPPRGHSELEHKPG